MSNKDVSTPAEEVSSAPEAKEETQDTLTEESKEETIASAMNEKSENKIPDSIPYDRFQEKVHENKELESRIAELEQKIQDSDTSKREVNADIKDIAAEYDIPAEVLDKVADSLYSKAQATIDEKLAPLTQKEKQEQQDKVLSQMLNKALENNPDFKSVVNPDVIKQLALNPANANKTMSQIIQDTYGNAVTPSEKKTMESVSPGKSEVIDKVDYDRAQTDSAYFSQIKADPELKKQYNEEMTKRLSRVM